MSDPLRIPQAFIDELLNRTDIYDLINSQIPLKKQGTSYVACCPFHTEKTPSFNVIPKKQFYHCFGCGVSGNAISFLMQYLNQPFLEVIESLASRVGMHVPRTTHDKFEKKRPLQDLLYKITQNYQNELKKNDFKAQDYLKNRGISELIAQRYQLGYAPAGWHYLDNNFKQKQTDLLTTGMIIQKDDGKHYDRFRDRLMFPIQNRHGHYIGFGGRTLDDNEKPKYLNSPETILFQKNRELYGLYHVLQQNPAPSSILIVEGYMDVIGLASQGITNAVATLGTATSSMHLQLLNQYNKHLIFCFDGDAAGRKAAWRALEGSLSQLSLNIEPAFIFLPEGHDPDSLVRMEGPSAFQQRLKNAIPLHRFFFDTLLQSIDQTTLAGKSQLIHLANPHLQNLSEGPYKQLLIEELSRLTHIEALRIQQLIPKTAEESVTKITIEPIKRTPARVALALLIQDPAKYISICQTLDLNILEDPSLLILKKVIQRILTQPQITTAVLIEPWRKTSIFEALTQLVTWEHHVPENTLLDEFRDIMNYLSKKNSDAQVQALLNKARQSGLTDSERKDLQTLLANRHQSPILS